MILQGGQDTFALPSGARDVKRMLGKGSSLEEFPNGGHELHRETQMIRTRIHRLVTEFFFEALPPRLNDKPSGSEDETIEAHLHQTKPGKAKPSPLGPRPAPVYKHVPEFHL